MLCAALPFNKWADKDFEYVEAFQHLCLNLLRAERFKNLVLVLPEWYRPNCSQEHHYTNGMDLCNTALQEDRIWKSLTTFLHEKSEQLNNKKAGMKTEIVRLYDEKKVLHDEWVSAFDSWQAYIKTVHFSHDWLIANFTVLATEKLAVEVKGACVSEDSSWAVIEDLPESAFLNEVK
jgi:hypothetical protein